MILDNYHPYISMNLTILFWLILAILIYTYAGFPLLLYVRTVLFSKSPDKMAITPFVSYIIPVFNEEKVIRKKIVNLLSLDYPPDRWEAIVASDGSTDGTYHQINKIRDPRIRWLDLPRLGKNAALNSAIRQARGEIVIFTDADAVFEKGAVASLVSPFADPEVGGVAGDVIQSNASEKNRGEHSYWNFDRLIKRLQSSAGSVTSATGQIYAVRREHLTTVPPGVIDDFFISTQVVSNGSRLVFEPEAVAYSDAARTADMEYARKIRNLTIGFQGIRARIHLMNPFKYGFYSLQLFSHKVLRRIMGIPFLALFVLAALLIQEGIIYRSIFLLQAVVFCAALIGYLLRNTGFSRIKLFALPYYLNMVNIAAIFALVKVIYKQRDALWAPER